MNTDKHRSIHSQPCSSVFICGFILFLASVALAAGEDDYKLGPDSMVKDGVPRGNVTTHVYRCGEDGAFPGTIRRYYVYVPAQYDSSQPAAVMVFQDGHNYIKPDGQMRVPTVFDNLIAAGDMPVTIGIFIDPGHKGDELPGKKPGWSPKPNNRSFEYDTLSDAYARFVIDEVLPLVGKSFELTDDPNMRAIGGISSGGICAWTVAWERPDAFRKVLSHVGSFTNIRGGHNCQALIRKTEKKPIRVILQDGSNDLDNVHGNWPLGNQQMAASLKFKKYDYKFVYGTGGHNGKHGGAILPDSLRWLWRGWKNAE